MLSQFFEYDREVPLDARSYDREQCETFIREKIVFYNTRDHRVPGYLAVPTDLPPPYPAVFLLHGLGASNEDWWNGSSDEERFAGVLLSSGYAVFALDVPYHGERTHNSDYESAWSLIAVSGRVNQYREMLVQSVLEHRRAIDYLTTRSEIDVAHIGVFGCSIGGLVTYILSAIDLRIKAAVAAAACPMSDFYIDYLGWGDTAKERLAPVAPRNHAPAIKHAAFLMLNGKQDQYGTVEEIRSLHGLVGAPSKELVFFDSGHRLPSEYVPKAVDWFRRHL